MSTAVIDETEAATATDDLAGRTVRSAGWTAGGQLGRQLVQMVISVVTARLLLPRDFGQVAQIVVLAGFANVLSDFGLGPALVQRKGLEERHRSSVFWLQLGLGFLVTSAVILVAPLIASFYGQPALRGLAMALAPSFLLSAMCTAPRALLTRAMRFRELAFIDLAALTASGAVCIVGAALGFGVMAIVCQIITLNLTTCTLLWLVGRWRPQRMFDRSAIKELLPFSGNLVAFTTVNYIVRKGDNLLVGRFLGPTSLGLYSRGYNILLYPNRQISAVLGNVMFSSLSKVSDDITRLRRGYLRAIAVIALITFPLMSGLALIADRFVPAVLGQHWVAAVPLIRIFAVLGIGESIFTTVGWIYQSTGRTDKQLRIGLLFAAAPLGGIVIGMLFGSVLAVTIGYGTATTLMIYPFMRMAGSLIDMSFADVMRSLRAVALCTAGMVVTVALVRLALPDGIGDLAAVAVLGLTGVLAYATLVHLFHVDAYVDLRGQVTEVVSRRKRS